MKNLKIRKYLDLAEQIICQVCTQNNLNSVKNAIKHKNDFQMQCSRGGLLVTRGYYCPSLVEEILITNARRGKLLASDTKKRPDYYYYFDNDKLVLIQKNLDNETFRYEWVNRVEDTEISLYMEENEVRRIIISTYDGNRIIENIFLTIFFSNCFDMVLETYSYKENKLVSVTRKDVSIFNDTGREEIHYLDFIYNSDKLKCFVNGKTELHIPPIVEGLITGKQKTVKKPLCKTDISKALKNAVTSWKNENIYAISVFINHSGHEVTDFAISFNIEEHQVGEERWNYAFWNQEEKDLMYLLEERETDWKKLLELISSAVRKLQEDGFFKKVFGKDIAVIIHGYEYEDIELEATRNANPNGQADAFFKEMKALGIIP